MWHVVDLAWQKATGEIDDIISQEDNESDTQYYIILFSLVVMAMDYYRWNTCTLGWQYYSLPRRKCGFQMEPINSTIWYSHSCVEG